MNLRFWDGNDDYIGLPKLIATKMNCVDTMKIRMRSKFERAIYSNFITTLKLWAAQAILPDFERKFAALHFLEA